MKVMDKAGSIYGPGLTDFSYKKGDYVTIVLETDWSITLGSL